jgi:hypothetical protein
MMQVARKAPRHRHNPVRGKPGCAGRVAKIAGAFGNCAFLGFPNGASVRSPPAALAFISEPTHRS